MQEALVTGSRTYLEVGLYTALLLELQSNSLF